MHDLIDYLLSYVVDDKDYEIILFEDGAQGTIKILTSPDNLPKIIGKQGRMIKALRTFIRAHAHNTDMVYDILVEAR
ncbi:MAG: KH domain-containing protein [Christensenellaceae bacterium]|jgi:predicted RNA-binding protein YlqC (UPF0109 family)|nr:KH domain-containing protein [Christensenellaceae bacterium]